MRSMLKRQLARKVFPVHRLDHRTSGAILFAFDSETAGKLHTALADGRKDYIAIVRGEWKYDEDTVVIDQPLKVDEVLKDAVTKFTRLASSTTSELPFSILRCQPETGRTHQIRRHAYHLGHPIIGDSQHGDSKVNRSWRTQRGMNRLGLHCLSIQLKGMESQCLAPLSPELQNVLSETGEVWDQAIEREPRLLLDPVDDRGGTFGRNYRARKSSA
uniref:Pseudouridine synthase RsuA/RluA-like domain-containing protein n=1 Tax=Cyclophora tenuis TaxID=216820 RepID=A0A7S1DC19_CYCTE